MGFVDKLKNIFFEEEEEEDEEIEDTRPPKKEKEEIARRVEIPKRRKEKEVTEVEIKEEPVSLNNDEIDDDFFEIKKEPPKKEPPKKEPSKINDLIFDDEDFILDIPKKEEVEVKTPKAPEVKETRMPENTSLKYEKPVYEYTSRQEREVKKVFTPSPIISPIYGILDKNYKKEEVKERKEIRIYSRSERMDLDSVRNKAFGDLETQLFPSSSEKDEKEEMPEESPKDIKKVKEKMQKENKPAIDKVTLGEADEYFNDLGLGYNTDYKDISKEINDGKVPKDEEPNEDKLEDNLFDLIESMYDKED